jgi:subtilisin family serine protease
MRIGADQRGGPRASIVLLAGVAGLLTNSVSEAIISSGTSGLWLNQFLGATRYYEAGYTGTLAIVATVEGGHIWNGHVALSHVGVYVGGPGVPGAPVPPFAAGTPNFHAHTTMVGHVLAGRRTAGSPAGGSDDQRMAGIAFGAELWSGSIATSFAGPGSFSSTFNAAIGVYNTILRAGVSGATADVVNSSFSSFSSGPPSTSNNTPRIIAIDALTYASGKTVVVSAGNRGSAGTVGDPGLAKNVITVGALTGAAGEQPYSSIAPYSSRGPSDFVLATGATTGTRLTAATAPIDLMAPGDPLTLAAYGGASGGNTGGFNNLAADGYTAGATGTSFAAPIVAGAAGLVVDAARGRGFERGGDGRVVKALLMNSADKLPGWSNGLAEVGGVLTTTQGVDWTMGAGRVNMARAYDQQLLGTADVPGLGGGVVGDLGWDFGVVGAGAANDYAFASTLAAGTPLTATLAWFASDLLDLGTLAVSSANFGAQDLLTLELRRVEGDGDRLIAQSIAPYNLNQHLSMTVPQDGRYFLRVNWAGSAYDLIGKADSEAYGLAWQVPTPGALGLGVLVGLVVMRRGRGRRPSDG